MTGSILYTDQYQLTMAQLYFRMGLHETRARFEHFFRNYPVYDGHQAGFCVNAGLQTLLEWMDCAACSDDDIEYLKSQTGRAGDRIFKDDFLEWLRAHGDFRSLNLQAIPEGRIVHANVPLTVVEGPLAVAQLLETALLNQLNYQTLIATKAARIHQSGRGQPVLEFGLRRSQGYGGSDGARAALLGGAAFSSNVAASRAAGYPPKGTHAHSMVQAFMARGEGELAAFRAYADVYPDDCLLLVDTIDTLESGIPNAITVFEELRHKGHEPVGIRLDSGDLAHLSVRAAKMLNEAGFPDTKIVLSNKLDEIVLEQIIGQVQREAPQYGLEPDSVIRRYIYGVGTRLITSEGAPALDGVYKLVALSDGGDWRPAIKVSETAAKTLNPGRKRVWRIYDTTGKAVCDLLALPDEDPRKWKHFTVHHPFKPGESRSFDEAEVSCCELMLCDVTQGGKITADMPGIQAMRSLRDRDIDRLYDGVLRLVNPHCYHVSLSSRLWQLKQDLVSRLQAS